MYVYIVASGGIAPAIALTDTALKHLNKMRSEKNEDLCLRIGVKQGGCSGMSYSMEFETKENTRPDDTVMEYDGFLIGIFLYHTIVDSCTQNRGGNASERIMLYLSLTHRQIKQL
ncbi:putative FeS assembly protein IscA, plant/cyanobacteria type [Helianthus debilis subsp. tardiflorus]